MSKWEVKFDVRKGNNTMLTTEKVEAEAERTAIQLAEAKSKKSLSSKYNQGYTWHLHSVKRK